MRAEFHPLAARELVEDAEFYEARAKGLGARFLDAVERAVSVPYVSRTIWILPN
ncbi:MAG: hypothetical protein R2909_02810 [Gemmatimonadales bacterium]